jgi:predicted DNA-binding transcriptional regulator YafY
MLVIEASWKNTILFNYTNKAGETKYRKVEVYDVKNKDSFFGYDLIDNKTKNFLFENMSDVEVGDSFEPRFPRPDREV